MTILNLLNGYTMKTHVSLIKCLIGFILLSLYACEKDKPANNFDLLTNGSSKVWYLKRMVPNVLEIELPECITDDEHKFMSNGKYIIDNMGTYITIDENKPPYCSDAPNITFTYSWNFNFTMDTLTIDYSTSVCMAKVQKLTRDSLIIKFTSNDCGFRTEYFVSKK